MNKNIKTPAEMLDDAIDYIVETTDAPRFTLEECLGFTKESLNAVGINRFDYIFGDDDETEEHFLLSGDEYNGLLAIAHDTKMDCWFCLDTRSDDTYDYDVVKDLENDTILSIREGLEQLADGLVEPLDSDFYRMNADERAAVKRLFAKYGIPTPQSKTVQTEGVLKCYRVTRHKEKESHFFNWSNEHTPIRKFAILGSDVTGFATVTYALVERESDEACDAEMSGQLSDGWFEDSSYGECTQMPAVPLDYRKIFEERVALE